MATRQRAKSSGRDGWNEEEEAGGARDSSRRAERLVRSRDAGPFVCSPPPSRIYEMLQSPLGNGNICLVVACLVARLENVEEPPSRRPVSLAHGIPCLNPWTSTALVVLTEQSTRWFSG